MFLIELKPAGKMNWFQGLFHNSFGAKELRMCKYAIIFLFFVLFQVTAYAQEGQQYEIKSGDTLSGICHSFYKDGTRRCYQALADYNGVLNPDRIWPGRILCLGPIVRIYWVSNNGSQREYAPWKMVSPDFYADIEYHLVMTGLGDQLGTYTWQDL